MVLEFDKVKLDLGWLLENVSRHDKKKVFWASQGNV